MSLRRLLRRKAAWAALSLLLLLWTGVSAASSTRTRAPTMKKLSPVIVVDAVEPCLPFWTERLGFEVTVTVPHEDALGFAILEQGGVSVMYQSRASVEADVPALANELDGQRTALYIEVQDVAALDALEEALAGADVVVPRRTTFYGMDEISVRAPCGTVVGLAAAVPEGAGGG